MPWNGETDPTSVTFLSYSHPIHGPNLAYQSPLQFHQLLSAVSSITLFSQPEMA